MELADELKEIMHPLYHKHQDDIITGAFSEGMMADWDNGDANLLKWRAATGVRLPPLPSQNRSAG
jgi:ketol-acid reductoisomerase